MLAKSIKLYGVVASLLLVGCSLDSNGHLGQERLSRSDVLEFIDRWVAAEATEDFANLAPLVHPDAVYRSNDGDHVGISAIRESFESTFASSPDQNYTIENVRVSYRGMRTAAVVYTWNWTGRTPDGVKFRVTGRGTKVIARDEQGLRLRLLHLNQDTAAVE